MVKTVIVNDSGKLAEVVQFEVPTENFDLKQAIYEACMEYCKTEEGWEKYSAAKIFDVNSFLRYVPNAICEKYRFYQIQKPEVCMVIEKSHPILTKHDMEESQCFQIENVKEYEVCQLTAWFARMWGVMETLGDLPQQDFENTINSLISWAEEFLKKGEQDPILFFQQKIKVSENES